MMLSVDATALQVFETALPEVKAWCATKPNLPVALTLDEPDPALRTLRLCPNPFSTDYRWLVISVVEARWYALGTPPRDGVRSPEALHGGRILYYDPAMSLADGAACVASQGFFDVDNIPAWDTWLCFADDRFLVSWIPAALMERVSAGIAANPEHCISWAEEVDTPFTRMLRAKDLA